MTETSDTSFPPRGPQFDGICLKLRGAIEGIGLFQRRFHPPGATSLAKGLASHRESLKEAMREIWEMIVPDELDDALAVLEDSGSSVLDILETILAALSMDVHDGLSRIMRTGRKLCRVQEALYRIRSTSPYLDQLFLEPGAYHLAQTPSAASQNGVPVGLAHANVQDDDYARGAFSYYVPESYDGKTRLPLVLALHGGSGHGRDFVWTWLREARSRRFILVAPSSIDRTWSLQDSEVDGSRLIAILSFFEEHYPFDMDNILLTGMSDGGTFALMCSLQQRTPFSAFAPVAGVLPPFDLRPAEGKRIYWVHGALDWMFPIFRAEEGSRALRDAGADIEFRMIDDLSHTYPREENDRILRWFDPRLALT